MGFLKWAVNPPERWDHIPYTIDGMLMSTRWPENTDVESELSDFASFVPDRTIDCNRIDEYELVHIASGRRYRAHESHPVEEGDEFRVEIDGKPLRHTARVLWEFELERQELERKGQMYERWERPLPRCSIQHRHWEQEIGREIKEHHSEMVRDEIDTALQPHKLERWLLGPECSVQRRHWASETTRQFREAVVRMVHADLFLGWNWEHYGDELLEEDLLPLWKRHGDSALEAVSRELQDASRRRWKLP